MSRINWNDNLRTGAILEISAEFGRMPTVNEMRSSRSWGNALACQLSRTGGGLAGWAKRLGLKVKNHDSGKGWKWEDWVARISRANGARVAQSSSVKAPFDLTVNGQRVDVKCAEWGEYGKKGHVCRGWIFNQRGKEDHCDYYVFVCIGSDVVDPRVYVMPCNVPPASTLTITESGKYEHYRDRWNFLGFTPPLPPLIVN